MVSLCSGLQVLAQSPDHHRLIEELIEELTSDDMMDTDLTIVYDNLLYYINHPLDVNIASADDLRRLHFINELLINNLTDYRRKHGEILTLYELQYVEGFSPDDIRKILPFISVGEVRPSASASASASDIFRYGRHQFFMRFQQVLEEQRGFSPVSDSDLASRPNSRYLGSPLKIYNRYQFNYSNKLQAGYVAEKDAGEEFLKGTNPYGFDYYSLHLQINDIGRIKTIALGDYQTSFGQGLVLWSGLSFGKSSATLSVRKNQRGIQKYSSTDENLFFRGAAITYGLSSSAEASLFVSRKKIDAGVSLRDKDGRVLEVSSLQSTGLHATPSQMEGKNVLGETLLGGNLSYNHNLFRLGMTVAALEYDAVLNPPERVYNHFDFRGERNVNGGLDYQFSIGRVRLFGEGAISSSGGTALLGGAMANVSSKMSLSALYRNYARNYHAYHSSGFRENTRTANEEGFYMGTEIHPLRRWKVSAYIDLFSFPWMRYSAYAPSSGLEYFGQVDFIHSRSLNMYLSFRRKEKPLNEPSGEGHIRDLVDSDISRMRYHINYFASSSLELRNRVEFSQYSQENNSPEKGFLLYQDVLYKPVKLPFSFAFRYAVFETTAYNARIYAYENDVLYAFSIPAYYDKGFRTYFLVQYRGGEWVDLWLRYAISKWPDREDLGSGLNQIDGNSRSEIKLQVRLRF